MKVAGVLLQNASTGGNGDPFNLRGEGTQHSFYITGAGTISSGVLMLERATSTSVSNAWSSIASVTISTATQVVSVTGVLDAVRARITTNVAGTGGSVTVKLVSTE